MECLYKKLIKNYEDVKDPKVVKKYGLFSGIVGIILNILLFIIKITVALLSGSVSIASDAFNNLSDASSSIITIIGFKVSSKPADKEHPYGHGRAEYISAFIISFIILFIGIELGISSVNKIINPSNVDFSYALMIVLCVTVLIKLWMGIFYNKMSKRINSLSLKANSKDSINDVITTSIVILGLFIGKLFGINLDGYLGAIVSIYIIISGINLIKETINKLIGGTPDLELIKAIESEILSNCNILGVHDTLYHYYGGNKIYMSLDAEVDSCMSLVDAHDLVDSLEDDARRKYGVELVIHVDPIYLEDERFNNIKEEINKIIMSIDNRLGFHDLKITEKGSRTIISFDLQVPYNFKINNEDLYKMINNELNKIDKKYKASIVFDLI